MQWQYCLEYTKTHFLIVMIILVSATTQSDQIFAIWMIRNNVIFLTYC